MNSYFIWDGSPEIFTIGPFDLPISLSIPGLIIALLLYFGGIQYLSKQYASDNKKRRRKSQDESKSMSGWMIPALIIGALVLGQLIALPFGGGSLEQLGPLSVRWYGMLFALSFLLGYYLGAKTFEHAGKHPALAESLFIYLIAGTVLGARLGHVLFYDWAYYSQNLHEILYFWQGGLASHGAFIGVLLSIYLFARKNPGTGFMWTADRIAIPFALGGMFVRIGNFFNSEILGSETDVSWAVIFTREDLLPRHPAMLYEAAAYFLLFLVLIWVYRSYKNAPPEGSLTGIFMVGVFAARFVIEFAKERQPGFDETLSFLSMGQLLSVPVVLVGLWLLLAKVNWRNASTPSTNP